MQKLGTGVLDWNRKERISDRYGVVKLFNDPGATGGEVKLTQITNRAHGRLIAVVEEVREAGHIGDLFHGVFPTTPELHEKVILGEGLLFFEDEGVGLFPDDARRTFWLNIQSLYRVHNQTVTLFSEESPTN